MITAGDPSHQYSVRLRWDLDYRYWLVGSQSSIQFTKRSKTYDDQLKTEELLLGDHPVRLPTLVQIDLPSRDATLTPIPDQGHADSLLPMGPNGPLWQQYHQFQLSNRHLLLGTYRLPSAQQHTHHELHTDGDLFCTALQEPKHHHQHHAPNLSSSNRHRQWTPYLMRVELSSDYTQLPLSLFVKTLSSDGKHHQDNFNIRMRVATSAETDRHHLGVALIVDPLHAQQRLRLNVAASLHMPQYQNDTLVEGSPGLRFSNADEAIRYCKHQLSSVAERRRTPTLASELNMELILLGRLDAQSTFIYGRDLLLNRTTLSWHIVQPSQGGPVTSEYLWLMFVCVPLLALWYLAIYEKLWIFQLVNTINQGYQSEPKLQPNQNRELLSSQNQGFRRDLCVFTQVVVCSVSVLMLLVYRVDTNMQGLLVSAEYSAACVYMVIGLALLLCCNGPNMVIYFGHTSCVEMSNALLWTIWLVNSAQSHLFFNGMLMLVANGLVVRRDLEEWLLLVSFRLAPVRVYNRAWVLWLVWVSLRLAASCFILGGYSLPLFIELQWPNNGFNWLLELTMFGLLTASALNMVGNQYLLVARERNLRMAERLSKRPVMVTSDGHYSLVEPAKVEL